MITSSTYCLCGGELTVSSDSWQAVEDIHSAFVRIHTGDEHQLFPTAAEAKQARKAVAS